LKTILSKVKVPFSAKMAANMSAPGIKTNETAMESTNIPTEKNTMGSGKLTKNQVTAFTTIWMDAIIMGSGKMTNGMDKEIGPS